MISDTNSEDEDSQSEIDEEDLLSIFSRPSESESESELEEDADESANHFVSFV